MDRRRVAFFLPHKGCGRKCVYCDQTAITRDAGADITPETVAEIAKSQKSPVEICFFGGSFARTGQTIMTAFLDAARSAPEGSAVTFSSYPGDFDGDSGLETIRILKNYPISTIELGIPTLDREVLKTCRRDDDPEIIIRVINRLIVNGFHLGVQMMIGLPGQTNESAHRDLAAIASLMPFGAKWHFRLYPCLVLEGAELAAMYERGDYVPLTLEEAVRTAGELSLKAERLGLSVIRVGLLESESLKKSVVAGPHHPAFGELAMSEKYALSMREENMTGPWTIESSLQSRLTGHGGRGVKRLAELCGMPEREVRNRLIILSPESVESLSPNKRRRRAPKFDV